MMLDLTLLDMVLTLWTEVLDIQFIVSLFWIPRCWGKISVDYNLWNLFSLPTDTPGKVFKPVSFNVGNGLSSTSSQSQVSTPSKTSMKITVDSKKGKQEIY